MSEVFSQEVQKPFMYSGEKQSYWEILKFKNFRK